MPNKRLEHYGDPRRVTEVQARRWGWLQNMKRATTLLLTMALVTGCNRAGGRSGEAQVQLCSNLTVTIYQQVAPDGVETTTVNEVWNQHSGNKRLVTSIFSDSRGKVITLIPTPISGDWLPFSPGIFWLGGIGDIPVTTLSLSIGERGAVEYMRGFTKKGNRIYTVAHFMSERDVDRLFGGKHPPRVVNLSVEGGAPFCVVTNQIAKWTSVGADVRLSVLPWDLAHPVEIVDSPEETEPQPTIKPQG